MKKGGRLPGSRDLLPDTLLIAEPRRGGAASIDRFESSVARLRYTPDSPEPAVRSQSVLPAVRLLKTKDGVMFWL